MSVSREPNRFLFYIPERQRDATQRLSQHENIDDTSSFVFVINSLRMGSVPLHRSCAAARTGDTALAVSRSIEQCTFFHGKASVC
ncbi:MAG: hypothetical protein ACRC2T_07615 [Thermoguttaceae bacterium]